MLVVGAVALATLGPKEILKTVRLVGGAARKMRMTAWEFREQIEERGARSRRRAVDPKAFRSERLRARDDA